MKSKETIAEWKEDQEYVDVGIAKSYLGNWFYIVNLKRVSYKCKVLNIPRIKGIWCKL